MNTYDNNISTLLSGIVSTSIDINIRRMNYRILRNSSTFKIIPKKVVKALLDLDKNELLIQPEGLEFPEDIPADVQNWIKEAESLPGMNQHEYSELLFLFDTALIQQIALGKMPIPQSYKGETVTDLKEWYEEESKPRESDIDLIVPEIVSMVGDLRTGKNMLIGGFTGSFKTTLLANIVCNHLRSKVSPVLFISPGEEKKYICSHLYGLKHRKVVKKDNLILPTEIEKEFPSMNLMGIEDFEVNRNTTPFRERFNSWIHQNDSVSDLILVIDGLEEFAFRISPVGTKEKQALLMALELLKFLVAESGKSISILASYRFSERVYSNMRKRIEFYDKAKRQVGFEYLEMGHGLSSLFIKNEMQNDLVKVHKRFCEEDPSLNAENYKELGKLIDVQNNIMDHLKGSMMGTGSSILNENDAYNAPHGQYEITDFQEVPELEQLFHLCISTWCDISMREKGQAFVKLVKNRDGETMGMPALIAFQKQGDKWNELPQYILRNPSAEAKEAGKFIILDMLGTESKND